MAFDDNPIVDDNSKRSEESEHAVRHFFNRKSGFLCRDELPDLGVDLDVELIEENSTMSAFKFAIQIKSTAKATYITKDEESFISFSFKPSRLRYLAQRTPGCGLIILYDESAEVLFFDYIEDIITRVQASKEDESWKDQLTVNIHFPVSNKITPTIVQRIYDKFLQRKRNHDLLLQDHGESYHLPVYGKPNDPINLTVEELEENGSILINNQEFKLLHFALSGLKRGEIRKSKLLCLYAAVAYSEIGDVIEAKYYLSRCKQFRETYSPSDKELLLLIGPRVDFISGEISLTEYGKKMDLLFNEVKNPLNILNVKLNLMYLKVLDRIRNGKYTVEFDVELKSIFSEIEQLEIKEENRNALIIQHSDIVLNYTNAFLSKNVIRQRIREKLNYELSDQEKEELITRYFELRELPISYLEKVFNYSNETQNDILKSNVLFRLANYFLITHLCLVFIKESPPLTYELKKQYLNHVNNLFIVFNVFIEEKRKREAHLSLNFSLDLRKLFSLEYGQALIDEDENETIKLIEQIEFETGMKKYNSHVEEAFHHFESINQLTQEDLLLRSSDQDIEKFAHTILEVYQLPEDRLINIIAELKNYKKFHEACKNPDLDLLQDLSHNSSIETSYKYPPKYIIRNMKTGLKTLPSTDIDELLEAFKDVLNEGVE